ncbi:MAG: hypothetical protein BWY09_01804 [Candidatus Hydrogenedentes bacterium ADurb.Bin179]|nr:MAG: hypothetical protein BWY09_01804 [Candidatus Hydrogenedentes bacterium ADurb.Bin179]
MGNYCSVSIQSIMSMVFSVLMHLYYAEFRQSFL